MAISQVELESVRDQLLAMFACWGPPRTIKVDNGRPFGDPMQKSIPPLALWLIGLGIDISWNRPRQPTDNAKVERMQKTSSRWAEVDRCANLEQLATRLDDVALVQREQYQVSRLGFKTRKQAFQGLYRASCDPLEFDIERVHSFLAQLRLVRRVSSNGRISVLNQGCQIGLEYKGQEIGVGFDPESISWLFFDQDDKLIKQIPAQRLSEEEIVSFSSRERTS